MSVLSEETNVDDARSDRQVALGDLRISAKVDYLSVYAERKVLLPVLDGRAIWPASHNGRVLTVHDATAQDVFKIAETLGNNRLHEVEVCIDFRCGRSVPASDRRNRLQGVVVDLFARQLYPRGGPLMKQAARAFYRRVDEGYIVRPFNRRLPTGTDQQLHGWRGDWAQVKVYWKHRDNRRELPVAQHSARVEVRLRGDGLNENGLENLLDLIGFKYRKQLSPYFRTVRSARLKSKRAAGDSPLLRAMRAWQQHHADLEWVEVGVGAVQRGGNVANHEYRLLRDVEANDRIGQSLHRLEKSFRIEKFVRSGCPPDTGKQVLARPAAQSRQSPMTYQV